MLNKLIEKLEEQNFYFEHIPYNGYPEKVIVDQFHIYADQEHFVIEESTEHDSNEVYSTKQLKRVINFLNKN